jgi:hypothetical protein
MALIKSSLLADIRGSIGGTTYSRNRGGSYARNRTVPINPQSINQTRARSQLAVASSDWGLILDNTDRSLWNAYAETVTGLNSLGEAITFTGQQMFVRANTLLSLAGQAPVVAAPTTSVVPALAYTGGQIDYDLSADRVDITLSAAFTGYVVAFCGPPQAGSGYTVKVPYRAFGSFFASSATLIQVNGSIPDRRTFSVGQYMAWRFQAVTADGRTTNELFVRGECVA